ncbi:MAG: DNA pilot protein [Arizlama microvirus]|nr:MAG: DNA pilot protein [Arizlama microvirus]
MSFLSDIAPVLGGAAGAYLGGPMGAMAGTSMGGAISSASGVADANNMNRDLMLGNNEFNRAEAVKNREYQTEMSNTQHQRTMTDLRKAGLNPMLAMGATNSSPSGASASSGSSAAMLNQKPDFSRAVSTAIEATMAKQNLENLKHQAHLTQEQIEKTSADTGVAQTAMAEARSIQAARQGSKNVPQYYKSLVQADNAEFSARTAEARRAQSTAQFQKDHSTLLNILDTAQKGANVLSTGSSVVKPFSVVPTATTTTELNELGVPVKTILQTTGKKR